ncbi:MBL fold metallo-hydrolase [Parapedobacter sp. ISTM3]|uniref:Glyoxylase, beta-lactamase superfamily II n=1 Tax=Parapedobacter luteus TaxID=623280 RepID=A0A1T5DC26_9SPHI|nr:MULTISPECIES: MBL fold metallo-hydrolase [Parapedobacter]MBK1438444.1 MBL fold metallo-hydrolase [Parapedobacter sp. ISTM3]SKB69302.1 Glyoxylase, beta-lactamase superfamily II [Parapedobacter luteus]
MKQADMSEAVALDGQMTDDHGSCEQLTTGVWRLKILFVNVYLVAADNGRWVLIDAGLKGAGQKIADTAAQLFGEDNPPAAIILTHGHFDHVGALHYLLGIWDVPIYAHAMEIPYLTGQAEYPPPDPFAGGGMMSWISFLYPNKPANLGDRVTPLDKDGSLPFLHKWRYLLTPGHAPGHISLFRDTDKVLIAGDAFVTTRQESAFSILFQKRHLSGPPKYFTYDWETAAESVKMLQELNPSVAASGHGKPMRGRELTEGLLNLVKNFDRIAVPQNGRYTRKPARVNRRGVVELPSARPMLNKTLVTSIVAIAVVGGLAWLQMKKMK